MKKQNLSTEWYFSEDLSGLKREHTDDGVAAVEINYKIVYLHEVYLIFLTLILMSAVTLCKLAANTGKVKLHAGEGECVWIFSRHILQLLGSAIPFILVEIAKQIYVQNNEFFSFFPCAHYDFPKYNFKAYKKLFLLHIPILHTNSKHNQKHFLSNIYFFYYSIWSWRKKVLCYIRFVYIGALGLIFNHFCNIFLETGSINTDTLVLWERELGFTLKQNSIFQNKIGSRQ